MSESVLTHTFKAFNTINTVKAYSNDESIIKEIDAMHARFELLFSRTNPQSELSRINVAKGKRTEVSAELTSLIVQALNYCELSGGLFDITMGAVVRLWNFKTATIPSQASIDEALTHVNYKAVHIEGNSVWLDDPKAAIDLGGIAKGYIADKLLELLVAHKVQSGLVNLGGNVAVLGERPDGNAWSVGVRMPTSSRIQSADKAFAALAVRNSSVVTSGIYERAFVHEDQLYHHILDPKTGYPAASDLLGATVISKTSLDGDGFTTALIILGLDKALEFIEARDELEAVFVTSTGEVYASSGVGKDVSFRLL